MLWKTAEITGWGRVLKSKARIARPERAVTLKALIGAGLAPAIGNRRSYGDAPLNSDGDVVDFTRMNRLIAFDPESGILEVEAGITIAEIARLFAPQGWVLPVMPGTGFATVGGAIANDIHGKSHHVAGSFGQQVESLVLLGANGRRRTITPEGNRDLFRATVGGLGQTGIILSARLRMLEGGSEVLVVNETRAENLESFMTLLEASHATYSVGWIDTAAKGNALGRGILEEGEYRTGATPLPRRKSKAVPMDFPGFFMSHPVVRAFNTAYYHRVPAGGRRHDRSLEDFFFPLDRIHDWNRLYGKPGFHQFQCVVPPEGAADVLERMMTRVSVSGLASPLAVLKRMGPGRGGMLSFPMEGYTLAIDFVNRRRTAALLQELEDMTLDAGGRIYFAKDALMRASSAASMYDELDDFRRIVNAADPERLFETDLVRRLNLRRAR